MILTVTLNAAIDRTVAVPNFRLGRRHRAVESRTVAGGKGINVARALSLLGRPVIATGFVGGPTGTRVLEQLREESVLTDFTRIAAETRINLAVIDPTSGEQTEINERGPAVSPEEVEALLRADRLPRRRRQDLRARRLAAAGRRRRPLRAPDRRPARAAASPSCSTPRARRCWPACAPAPRWSPRTSARPRSWSARSSPTAATSPTGLAELVRLGAGEAAITRPDGCVAAVGEGAERRLLEVHTEPLEPVSTVGSGDAFLAGYVAARYEGRAAEECLAYGVACGAESTQHFGAGTVDRNQVERLLGEVAVHDLEVPAEV